MMPRAVVNTSTVLGTYSGNFNFGRVPEQFDVGAVPEPSTWAMMLLGFAAIGLGVRRGRSVFAQVA